VTCLLVAVLRADWRRRRMFNRVTQRLHVDDVRGVRSTCPSPSGCLMQLINYGHHHHHHPRPQDIDSHPPGLDVTETSGERSSCCRCRDGSGPGPGGGGRLAAVVEECAVDRCRLPRCKWWKSLCTRAYLIAVNLASFVSVNKFYSPYTQPSISPGSVDETRFSWKSKRSYGALHSWSNGQTRGW